MSAVVGSNPGPVATMPAIGKSLGRLQLQGLVVIALFFGTFGVWSVMANLKGAVAVSGRFVVADSVKSVQHLQGGIVGELLVREGDTVKAGDVVMRLDPTIMRTNEQIIAGQLDAAAIRRARLEAERDDAAEFALPARLGERRGDPEVEKLIASETKLMQTKRDAQEGRRSQLRERVSQSELEIEGLKAQLDAKRVEAGILKDEFAKVSDLYSKRLVQFARYTSVQRDSAVVDGQVGQLVSAIAATEGKIAETRLQILQVGEDDRQKAVEELREVQTREAELAERLTAAEDQLRRVDIRAPVSGKIHELAVHTVGGVLQPGETAMQIVPSGEELQLEAGVAPVDIDQVTAGQTARVKLHAGNARMNPDLVGTVAVVSADTVQDQRTGITYYPVRVNVSPEELAKVAPLKVMAGMQAEVFIETADRTPLDFLLKPLEEQFDRTFRER